MRSILLFLENHLVRPMERVSSQRHLVAVRNGLLAVFPLSLIGSIFYLIANLPLPEAWAIQQFLVKNHDTIMVPYRMTVVLITLYMVVGVGAKLARFYDYDQVSGALVALAAFLMTTMPIQPSSMVPVEFLQSAVEKGLDTGWMQTIQNIGWVMPQTPMSGVGIYVGALSAIIGVETMHLFRYITAKLHKTGAWKKAQIPESITQTIDTIMPIAIVILGLFIVRDVIGLDFQSMVLSLFSAIVQSSSTLGGSLVYVLVLSLFSFFGVIGYGVSGSAAGVAWATLISANRAAHALGQMPPNVAPLPFFHYFIWIGGTGAVLSLVILMCFSKSRYLRRMGYSSIVPALANVNQPVIYGLPVILNPYMFIPFLLVPQVTTLLTYFCMKVNLVGRPISDPSNFLPFFAGAYMATGDWKAIILSIVNLGISVLIYYPFFKVYERKLILEGEQRAKKHALDENGELHVTDVD